MFIRNSNYNVEISFLLDTKNSHLPNPQFIIKDLGIVIENKLEVSKGSFSLLDGISNSYHVNKGSGSLTSNKESGNSNTSTS